MKRPLFWIGIVFLSSMAVFLLFSFWAATLAAALIALFAAVLSGEAPFGKRFALMLCCAAAGLIWQCGIAAAEQAYLSPISTSKNQTAQLLLTVCESDCNSGYCRLEGKADIFANGTQKTAYITLSGYFDEAVVIGETVSCTAQQCSDKGYKLKKLLSISELSPHPFLKKRLTVQRTVSDFIYANIPDKSAAGVLCALITGDKARLDDNVTASFRKSALSHLLVISGMHLILISAMLKSLLTAFIGKRAAARTALALCWVFAAISGLGVSVVRAAIMLSLLYLSELLKRRSDTLTSLCAAAIIIALPSPEATISVSFLLSFSAVCGLAVLEVPIFCALGGKKIKNAFASSALHSASAAASAQLATLPVCAVVFRSVPLLGVAANLAAVWLLPPIMLLGFCGLALAVAFPAAASLFFSPCVLLIRLMNFIAALFAKIPFSRLGFSEHWQFIWLFSALVLLLTVLCKRKALLKAAALGMAAVYLSAAMLFTVCNADFADIILFKESGCAAVIKGGHAVLLGSPQNRWELYTIENAFSQLGVETLDAVILDNSSEAVYSTAALAKSYHCNALCCEPNRYIASFCKSSGLTLYLLPDDICLFNSMRLKSRINGCEIFFKNGKLLKTNNSCDIIGEYMSPMQPKGAIRVKVGID